MTFSHGTAWTVFPDRIWEPVGNGTWASRPVTASDIEARHEVADRILKTKHPAEDRTQ